MKRIATKWVLTVLAAVLVPFLGFAWYVDTKMAERHWETVRYYLLTMAGEVAERLDKEVRERQTDIQDLTVTSPVASWTIAEWDGDDSAFRPTLRAGFDHFVELSQVFDLVLAVNARGELVVSNEHDAHGAELPREVLDGLKRDYRRESWFVQAMRGEIARVDHHQTDLLPPRVPSVALHPENFHIGFAVPVRDPADQQVVGAIYALMNWSSIQQSVVKKVRPRVPIDGTDVYQSSYVWVWMSDADTIVAHPDKGLYGKHVSEPPIDLPQLVEAARASDWGMYPAYEFKGVRKNAAFKHCAGPDKGGFGWIVGVGIDDDDTYATVLQLRRVLWTATAVVLSAVVLFTVFVGRRTTRPIVELKSQTQRVASGDLAARVEVRSNDELGDLARAFNEMTSELSESRAKLIKAEKDAAWREMARQVAHEIKNPLTPIALSANLLERARREESPEFDAIFDRTISLIRRQVENMRKIAADFSAFAGSRKPNVEDVDLRAVCDEVLELNAAWAAEGHITTSIDGAGFVVRADRGELRRVLINLVSNAFEAMPDGGALDVRLARDASSNEPRVVLTIEDSGVGLSDTVRTRLFEPYFTTRTHGTGLGLAISRRIVDEMGGTIALEPRADGRGTIARIVLPIAAESVA